MEQPRGLDAPVGVHAVAVRRRGGAVRPQPAAGAARPGAGGAGDDRGRVPLVHPADNVAALVDMRVMDILMLHPNYMNTIMMDFMILYYVDI